MKYVCVFYFRGVKQIVWNWQTASLLRRVARAPLPKYELTRQDWRLIRLSRTDLLKIPHMLLLVLVLEELLPLLVLFFPRAIPSTCHVPSQVEQAFEDLEARRAEAARRLTETPLTVNEQGKVENWQLVQLATLFGLPTWGSHQRIINRLVAHQKFLTEDDIALLSSSVDHPQPVPEVLSTWIAAHPSAQARALALGNSVPTAGPELARACRQRGLRSLGLPEADLQRALETWLDQAAPFAPDTSEAERTIGLAQRALALWQTDGLPEIEARAQERQKLGVWKRTKATIAGIVDAGSKPIPPPPSSKQE